MMHINTSKAPLRIVAADGDYIDALPGTGVDVSDTFVAKIRAASGSPTGKAAQAMLDELVPADSREAQRSRSEMERENRAAHAQAGIPVPAAAPVAQHAHDVRRK